MGQHSKATQFRSSFNSFKNLKNDNISQYFKAFLFGFVLSLSACGGGSSEVVPIDDQNNAPIIPPVVIPNPNNDPSNPDNTGSGNISGLSRTTVPPLGTFSITDSSLVTGKMFTVRYVNNAGLDQSLDFIADENGQVELVAPLALDQPNVTRSQQVDVMLDGRLIGTLTIEALPDHNLSPGEPLVNFLELILDTHNETYFGLEDKIDSGEFSASNETDYLFNTLDERSFFIEDYLDAVELYIGTGVSKVFQFEDGVSLQIDDVHIDNMDRYVLAVLYSVLESEQRALNAAPESSLSKGFHARANRAAFSDLFAGITDKLQLEDALLSVRRSLRTGEKGASVLLIITGTGVAAAGIIYGGSLGIVAGVGGIVLVGATIVHEFGNANALAEFVNNPTEAASRRAKNLREKFKDLALNLCGLVNVPCSFLGFAKGVKDIGTAFSDLLCSTNSALCSDPGVSACPISRSLRRNTIAEVNAISPRAVCLLPASDTVIPEPQPEPPTNPTSPIGTSQVLPTAALCPAQLGSREGSSFIFQEISRSSNNSHHCEYEWRNSNSSEIVFVSVIIFYTTEMYTTSRPRDEVFCTGTVGPGESILSADLTSSRYARTKVGSNSRQVQVEGQGQYFTTGELTSILRAAVSNGIGNGC